MLEDVGKHLELKGIELRGNFWSHFRFESPFGVRFRPHWSNLTIELRAG